MTNDDNDDTSPPDGTTTSTKDEEGLLRQYDVILCGTGLVQSIVASALARAGKTVLHCDAADFYGQGDAVWTLPYLLDQQQQQISKTTTHSSDAVDELHMAQLALQTNTTTQNHKDEYDDWKILRLFVSEPIGFDKTIIKNDTNNKNTTTTTTQDSRPFIQIHDLQRKNCQDFYPLDIGCQVSTPFGVGIVKEWKYQANETYTSLAITLDQEKDSDSDKEHESSHGKKWKQTRYKKKSPTTMYVGIPSDHPVATSRRNSSDNPLEQSNHNDTGQATETDEQTNDKDRDTRQLSYPHDVIPLAAIQCETILEKQARSFALDVTPSLLYAAGPAVEGLLTSQVSEYLEFKSLEGLLWYKKTDNASAATKQTKNSNRNQGINGHCLEKVPCSKNDVFASSLLSPMDKRRLMKFLHLALDYGVALEGQADDGAAASTVESLNERHLNQGRSLARPQNKAANTQEMNILQECIAENMAFETYLEEKQRLSPSLLSLVRYALALELPSSATNVSLKEGMTRLCHHMRALGRFGTTAFLYPLYGSGELSQAFCRSAAVFGATYLLRRAPLGIVVNQKENAVEGVVLRGTQVDEDTNGSLCAKSPTKRIKCSHIVVPQQSFQGLSSTHRVLRRVGILRGRPLQFESSNHQRHIVIFPPGSVVKEHTQTIHALLLDEHVNVAPHVPCGCTVVHLTTTISDNEIPSTALDEKEPTSKTDILDAAMKVLLASSSQHHVDELFHVSFSYGLDDESASIPGVDGDYHGLHVVRRTEADLAADSAFDSAAKIYSKICPDADFLKVAKAVDEAIQERLGDSALREDDEEKRVLESAMDLIEGPKKENKSEEI